MSEVWSWNARVRLGSRNNTPASPLLVKKSGPDLNAPLAKAPKLPDSVFVPVKDKELAEIVCVKGRIVAGDNAVCGGGGSSCSCRRSPLRPHFVKARVRRALQRLHRAHQNPMRAPSIVHGSAP